MTQWDLFKLIQDTEYKTAGDDVDYQVTFIEGRPALLFQESTTKRDWENNFNFPRKLYKKQERWLRVHRGFGQAWKSANDEIMAEFFKAVEIADATPIIAGWSFGGAMAILAAEDFNYRYKKWPEVVTFGAPKVAGDLWTASTIYSCGNFIQYANVNDVVPLCPPLPGFHHINKVKCGRPFRLLQLFKPEIHHCNYGDLTIYGGRK